MRNSRSRLAALLLVSLVAAGRGAPIDAQTAGSAALKLIPIPREVTASAVQSLGGGIQINCATPCVQEDAFAIDDLKA